MLNYTQAFSKDTHSKGSTVCAEKLMDSKDMQCPVHGGSPFENCDMPASLMKLYEQMIVTDLLLFQDHSCMYSFNFFL